MMKLRLVKDKATRTWTLQWIGADGNAVVSFEGFKWQLTAGICGMVLLSTVHTLAARSKADEALAAQVAWMGGKVGQA